MVTRDAHGNIKRNGTGHYVRPKRWGRIDITKTVDGEEVLYLRRWYLWRCKAFSVRLHHIVMEDVDRWPHDHPWNFVALVLRGGYVERWGPAGMCVPCLTKRVRFVNAHRATDVHRIVRFTRGHKGAWTLFITGPELRTWGFQTDEGWLAWDVALEQGVTT